MNSLTDLLLSPDRKAAVVADCARLVEVFLAGTGGLRGFALKTALSTAKAARPDILERAAQKLAPDFLTALDPFHQRWLADGGADFGRFLSSHKDEAVPALLEVADRRAARAKNRTVVSMYGKMRKDADGEIAKMLPAIGRMIQRHATQG